MRALIACAFLVFISGWMYAQPSDSIAEEFVVEAIAAHDLGRIELATRLLEVALEYDSSSSDALSLLGLHYSGQQETTRRGLELLELALESNRFWHASRNETIVALAKTLHETGRSSEAVELLNRTTIDPQDSRQVAADYAHTLISASLEVGARSTAERELMLAGDLFPNDPRFVSLALRVEPFATIEHARELDRLTRALEREDDSFDRVPDRPSLQEAVLRYAEQVTSDAERERAVELYLSLGGENPKVLALLAQIDRARAADLFDAWNGWRSLDLLRDVRFGALAELPTVADTLANATGEAFAEGVGRRWRERVVIEDGDVRAWHLDNDGDGLPELSLYFGGETPNRVVLPTPDGSTELEYDLYPFVERARVALHSGEEEYLLQPRVVEFRVLETVPAGGASLSTLPELVYHDSPSPSTLRQSAVRVDLIDSNGLIVERRFHASGDGVYLARDRNGDGRWDSLETSRGGVPSSRAIDVDYDGYFEVLEGFRDGRRLVRAVDEDDDGVPELFEREIGVSIREWDINEDGRIDVREFEGWRSSLVRDFPLLDQEMQ